MQAIFLAWILFPNSYHIIIIFKYLNSMEEINIEMKLKMKKEQNIKKLKELRAKQREKKKNIKTG